MSSTLDGSSSASLEARIRVPRDAFDVQATLHLGPGERLALLGPNGAGKSTVLGALAGTVPMQDSHVTLSRPGAERVLDAPGRRPLPVHRRGITLVEQRPLLFPHLDLRSNVAFGPTSRGLSRREALHLADHWLERVGLTDRARKRPHQLSGGQQQRVALARAFAVSPDVLLLDEPFAALDAESTPSVRGLLDVELARCGTTAVLVTHSLPDAWQLADRCAVVVDGRIVEETTPGELASTPRSRFGAVLADFAVLDGTAERDGLRIGSAWIPGTPDRMRPPVPGERAIGIVTPGDVELVPPLEDAEVTAPPPGVVPGVVETIEVRAGLLRVGARGGLVAELAPAAFSSNPGAPGMPRAGQTLWFRPRGLRTVGVDA